MERRGIRESRGGRREEGIGGGADGAEGGDE